MLGREQGFPKGVLVGILLQPFDLSARGHQRAYGAVGEPHHAFHHVAFARFDHAGALGLGDDHPDLLVADPGRSLGPLAENEEYSAT